MEATTLNKSFDYVFLATIEPHASSQRLFTMQVTDSWRVSIYNKYADVCMICMKCMLLIMNMQQSYADDLERQNEHLRQQLRGFRH